MADIIIAPSTHAHSHVWTSEAIERELSDYLSFVVPGSDYMMKLKKRHWDGRIRLFSRTTKLIPTGLVSRVIVWANDRGYSTENQLTSQTSTWTKADTESLLVAHPLPFDIRGYQRDAVTYALQQQRGVLISPTASGKSLILYLIIKARMSHGPILLIVPSISLVSQMFTDFESYGWKNAKDSIHLLTGGKSKDTEKPVVCATWQSTFRQPEAWFDRYTSIIGDEAHLFKAKSLTGIMEKLPNCGFRIGVTGTFSDMKSNGLMVEGVFGKPHRVARTVELQEQGYLAPIQIQGHFLRYNKHDQRLVREQRREYAEEVDFFVTHPGRMRWLVDFIEQLPGNVLVLYQFVEKHGAPLYHEMKAKVGDSRPVYFISGDVSAESRERTRGLLEASEHVVMDFGTGEIRSAPREHVVLSDGHSVEAQELTIDHDVSDEWIKERVTIIPLLRKSADKVIFNEESVDSNVK